MKVKEHELFYKEKLEVETRENDISTKVATKTAYFWSLLDNKGTDFWSLLDNTGTVHCF